MLSARDAHHAARDAYPDTVVGVRTAAAISRAEARLKALTTAYEDQCSRIRNELLIEMKAIERGWSK
jgi:hypothetical protein